MALSNDTVDALRDKYVKIQLEIDDLENQKRPYHVEKDRATEKIKALNEKIDALKAVQANLKKDGGFSAPSNRANLPA